MPTPDQIKTTLAADVQAIRERTIKLAYLGQSTVLKPGVASSELASIRAATTASLARARAAMTEWAQAEVTDARRALAETEPTPTDEARLARYVVSVDGKQMAESRLLAHAQRLYADGGYAEARLLAMAAARHGATGAEQLADACTGIIDVKDPVKGPAIAKRNAAFVAQAVVLREFQVAESNLLRDVSSAARDAGELETSMAVRIASATASAGAKVAAWAAAEDAGEPYVAPIGLDI